MKKFIICSLLFILCTPAAFAADSSCGDEKNEFINQRLALCSTHAYNIGQITNPMDAAGRQAMEDVVALKSTIITQQMKKQYDFLDTTVKRFKTQLEKAILTAKMEAAGASAESGGSKASKSTDKNVALAGTENCNNKSSRADVYNCLRNNYNVIYNMSNSGENLSTETRKQLALDYKAIKSNVYGPQPTWDLNCEEYQKIVGRERFKDCLRDLNNAIRSSSELWELEKTKAASGSK